MKQITARTLSLRGSSYDIGRQLGESLAASPVQKKLHTTPVSGFSEDDYNRARALFEEWSPGTNEELNGMADSLGVSPSQILYYSMTYLKPNCSHVAVFPPKTKSGHPLIARSYEFNDSLEDFCLIRTAPRGGYAHLGTSVVGVGRDDGINEHGLTVTMSSCNFPVGPTPNMRRPAVTGFQYWAVTRLLLEQCKTVEESVALVKELPIAYNINLIVCDAAGNGALIETLDGKTACRLLEKESASPWLYATNHPLIEEFIEAEPAAMVHSLVRANAITDMLTSPSPISEEDLKKLLLTGYPQGLHCGYYEEYFGTTKSMIFDPVHGTMELCWGGTADNGWHKYSVREPLADSVSLIMLKEESPDPSMFRFVPSHELS